MDEYEKRARTLTEEYDALPYGIKVRLNRLGEEILSCPSEHKHSLLESLAGAYQNAARTEPGSYNDKLLRGQIAGLSTRLEEEIIPKGEIVLKNKTIPNGETI